MTTTAAQPDSASAAQAPRPISDRARDYLNLDSLFTAEELALRDRVREFVQRRIVPNIAGWYEKAVFPREITTEMGDLGLLGMHLKGYGCAGRSATASAKHRHGVRELWGNAKGNYRSVGHYGAATVRGTKWLTRDTCAGTLVRVARGVVSVNDFTRHRTVLVRAPNGYLARAH